MAVLPIPIQKSAGKFNVQSAHRRPAPTDSLLRRETIGDEDTSPRDCGGRAIQACSKAKWAEEGDRMLRFPACLRGGVRFRENETGHTNLGTRTGRWRQSLSRPCPRRKAMALAAVLFVAGCSNSAQNSGASYNQTFGAITLAPGQSQSYAIGISFRLIRVCNNFESRGTVIARIGDRWSTTLGPGRCTESTGNTLQLTNNSGASATVVYRSNLETRPFY